MPAEINQQGTAVIDQVDEGQIRQAAARAIGLTVFIANKITGR